MPTLPGLTPPLVIAVLKQAQFGRELAATRGASGTQPSGREQTHCLSKKPGKLVTRPANESSSTATKSSSA